MKYGSLTIGMTIHCWICLPQPEVQERRIKKSRIHPGYSVDINGIQAFHDIGIILLDEPVNITEFVQPIDIGNLDPLSPGTIYGFGSINATEQEIPDTLRSREMEVIDDITCTLILRETKYKVTKECQNFCISTASCWGDSGGPFVQNNKLVGINSWAADDILGCKTEPGMLVRVTDYYEWIHESIEDMRNEELK
ncbi:kallikrein-13-like [Culicoides brevitarsis]|uniref:kallikrein-13-like n=1 Tax=Culicoides brevitarsis TaxID=469753 RepID=UPI00307BDAD9